MPAIASRITFLSVLVLAGCAEPTPKVILSPEAEAALPPGTDIANVRRLSNGCYFIVQDLGAGASTQPLIGLDGQRVCDPEPLEDFLNPGRVVVNEQAV